MQIKSNTARAVNATGLPLFIWADSRADHLTLLSLTPAARRIARRFGVPARRARLIAELAGLPSEITHV